MLVREKHVGRGDLKGPTGCREPRGAGPRSRPPGSAQPRCWLRPEDATCPGILAQRPSLTRKDPQPGHLLGGSPGSCLVRVPSFSLSCLRGHSGAFFPAETADGLPQAGGQRQELISLSPLPVSFPPSLFLTLSSPFLPPSFPRDRTEQINKRMDRWTDDRRGDQNAGEQNVGFPQDAGGALFVFRNRSFPKAFRGSTIL